MGQGEARKASEELEEILNMMKERENEKFQDIEQELTPKEDDSGNDGLEIEELEIEDMDFDDEDKTDGSPEAGLEESAVSLAVRRISFFNLY